MTAVVIMAKQPAADAKTRLAPALSEAERIELCAAMLADRVDLVAGLAAASPILAFTPPAAADAMREAFGAHLRLLAQPDGDLTSRLVGLTEMLFAEGHAGVVFLDTDSPLLSAETLAGACAALAEVDVALVPADDGGYTLIGLRRPAPAL